MDILELYAWVKKGKKRSAIIRSLIDPKTQKQLIDEHKLHSNTVYRILQDLERKHVVEFFHLQRKRKTYMLTKKGKLALQMLDIFGKKPATCRDIIKLLKLHHKLVTYMTRSLLQMGFITIFKTRNPAKKAYRLTEAGETVRERLEAK